MSSYGKMEDAMNGLGLILDACDMIRAKNRCSECPIVGCIDVDALYEIGDEVTKATWIEFFDLAEECDNYISEDDYIADIADMARKGERDDIYIGE